jgi:hypothetical protein
MSVLKTQVFILQTAELGLAISWTTEASVALAETALAFLFGIPSR